MCSCSAGSEEGDEEDDDDDDDDDQDDDSDDGMDVLQAFRTAGMERLAASLAMQPR